MLVTVHCSTPYCMCVTSPPQANQALNDLVPLLEDPNNVDVSAGLKNENPYGIPPWENTVCTYMYMYVCVYVEVYL